MTIRCNATNKYIKIFADYSINMRQCWGYFQNVHFNTGINLDRNSDITMRTSKIVITDQTIQNGIDFTNGSKAILDLSEISGFTDYAVNIHGISYALLNDYIKTLNYRVGSDSRSL